LFAESFGELENINLRRKSFAAFVSPSFREKRQDMKLEIFFELSTFPKILDFPLFFLYPKLKLWFRLITKHSVNFNFAPRWLSVSTLSTTREHPKSD
jgi:hypothetical protein